MRRYQLQEQLRSHFAQNPGAFYRLLDLTTLGEVDRLRWALKHLMQQDEIVCVTIVTALPTKSGIKHKSWGFYGKFSSAVDETKILTAYCDRIGFKHESVGVGISCPNCSSFFWKVIESRQVLAGIRRRRECLNCQHRLTTYEQTGEDDESLLTKLARLEELEALLTQIHHLAGRLENRRW
jgi:hypothetical protein